MPKRGLAARFAMRFACRHCWSRYVPYHPRSKSNVQFTYRALGRNHWPNPEKGFLGPSFFRDAGGPNCSPHEVARRSFPRWSFVVGSLPNYRLLPDRHLLFRVQRLTPTRRKDRLNVKCPPIAGSHLLCCFASPGSLSFHGRSVVSQALRCCFNHIRGTCGTDDMMNRELKRLLTEFSNPPGLPPTKKA